MTANYKHLAHTYHIQGEVEPGIRVLELSASFAYRIKSLSYLTGAGSCSLRILIGATPVGNSTVNATTTKQTTACAQPFAVAANDRVSIEVLSATEAERLYIQISIERI